MRYSILMYNFNNYEFLKEPLEIDPEAEYIYVTDNKKIKSNTWKIVYDERLDKLSVFEKCYYVRFHLFEYCHTDTCIYLDGSIQIKKSLKDLYEKFIKSGADIGLSINGCFNNLKDDYKFWIKNRNYPKMCADKCLRFLELEKYDFNYKSYFECNIRICRNTKLNQEIDEQTYETLKFLGKPTIERFDQPIYSYIINKYYNNMNVFCISRNTVMSSYLTWCYHNSDKPRTFKINVNKCFIFGKLAKLNDLI